MNKLTNVIIDQANSKISFSLSLDAPIDTAEFITFVDECDNVNNIYSDQSQDHTYYFNVDNSLVDIVKNEGNNYDITIKHEVISDMDDHIKYIKILTGNNNYIVEGIYYTSEVLFNAELTHIKRVCSTCLDNKCMQLITYVVFKRQLLESALELDDYKQCLILYNDLCRLLELSIDACPCTNANDCATCAGGCCSIK